MKLSPLFESVIDDLKKRDELGWKIYGRAMAPHDGRDSLQDAYEEVLDLAMYLKKAILERK